jgi:drug/metabolite transporter (DMT)-like permease
MSERQQGLVLIGILLCLSFVFQLRLKGFADQVAPLLDRAGHDLLSRMQAFARAVVTWRFLSIVVLAVALFVIWLLALTRLELSLALPLASVAIVINALGTGLALGETLTPIRIAGVIVIAVGVALVLRT